MKIGAKLLTGFLIVAVIGTITGIVGIINLRLMAKRSTEMYEVNTVPISQIGEIAVEFQRLRVTNRAAIIEGQSASAVAEAEQTAKESMTKIDKNLEEFMSTVRKEEIRKEAETFKAARMKYDEVIAPMWALLKVGKTKEAYAAMNAKATPIATAMQESIDKLVEAKVKDADGKENSNAVGARTATTTMIALVVVGFLLALILGIFIARSITNPMLRLVTTADQISQGNVNVDMAYPYTDEIGTLFHSLATVTSTLQGIIADTTQLTQAALEGKLDSRGQAEKYAGSYFELLQGVNSLMDAVVTPLNEAVNVLEKMAQNDLTARMTGEYRGDFARMKDNMNRAGAALETAIAQVLDIALQVADSSRQMASAVESVGKASQDVAGGAQQVAQGSTEQTRLASEAAKNMEQLQRAIEEVARGIQVSASGAEQSTESSQQASGAVKQIVEAAEAARKEADNAGQVAQQGATVVQQTVEGMSRVRETSADAQAKIFNLGEASKKIGEIVQAINDIAEQTNLLALNAAIEAARAGEHGKGFAVVADEVRKLAERSSRQTKEIALLVQEIQNGIESAVNAMATGSQEVEQGVTMVNKTGEALTAILDAMEKALTQVNAVSQLCERVTVNTNDVMQAVENVSSATQQVNAATEEMAASSTEVTQAVEHVVTIIEQSSATAEELSAAAEEQNASVEELTALSATLAELATNTRQQLEQFKVTTNQRTSTGTIVLKPEPVQYANRKISIGA
jgi:methyl-accepting chemotaxis protein